MPTGGTQQFRVGARRQGAEAAALRKAFPDELGGEQTFEEMESRELGAGRDTSDSCTAQHRLHW